MAKNKIEIPVNNGTGKLIYWPRQHKLGLPGKFGLIPAHLIDSISWDHPTIEGAPANNLVTIVTGGVLYAYSMLEADLNDLVEIRRQVQGARDIAHITQTLNN